MSTKHSAITKIVGAPTVGLAAGGAAGYAGRKEKRKWDFWKGDDGKVMIVRTPSKTKKAFDQKVQQLLEARGLGYETVLGHAREEVEKIAFLGGMIGKGLSRASQVLKPGGWRAAAGQAGGSVRGRLAQVMGDLGQRMQKAPYSEFTEGLTDVQKATLARNTAREAKIQQGVGGLNKLPSRSSSKAPAAAAGAKAKATTGQPAAASAPQATPPGSPEAARGGTSLSGVMQQAKDRMAGPLEQNFGVNIRQGMDQFRGGLGNWFGDLSPEQQRNVLGALGAGGVAAGAMGGASLAGGNTTVYT